MGVQMKSKDYLIVGFPLSKINTDPAIINEFIWLLECEDCGALIRDCASSKNLHNKYHSEWKN